MRAAIYFLPVGLATVECGIALSLKGVTAMKSAPTHAPKDAPN
jgi:hypothetical protein